MHADTPLAPVNSIWELTGEKELSADTPQQTPEEVIYWSNGTCTVDTSNSTSSYGSFAYYQFPGCLDVEHHMCYWYGPILHVYGGSKSSDEQFPLISGFNKYLYV